jgi:hypothetical protein
MQEGGTKNPASEAEMLGEVARFMWPHSLTRYLTRSPLKGHSADSFTHRKQATTLACDCNELARMW